MPRVDNKNVLFVSGQCVGNQRLVFGSAISSFGGRSLVVSSIVLVQRQVSLSTDLLLPYVEGVVSTFYVLECIPFGPLTGKVTEIMFCVCLAGHYGFTSNLDWEP